MDILADELEAPEIDGAVGQLDAGPVFVEQDADPPIDAGVAERDGDAQVASDAQVAADASTTLDAAPMIDAASMIDAAPMLDAAPTLDAASMIDAAPALDASADASDAAQPAPGVRVVVDYSAGGVDLNAFPVRVLLDTRALIQQGQLAADCANLRIFGGSGCGEARSYFLPAHACNAASSELWVRIPQLRAGMREVLAIGFDPARGAASNGSDVFPFFDDFQGTSLDAARWVARGQGTLSVSNGVLQSQGVKQIESVASAVSAGQSIVGAALPRSAPTTRTWSWASEERAAARSGRLAVSGTVSPSSATASPPTRSTGPLAARATTSPTV